MIKEKKTHKKKALKNTFSQQKNTTMEKKAQKNHFCFLKTLAGEDWRLHMLLGDVTFSK